VGILRLSVEQLQECLLGGFGLPKAGQCDGLIEPPELLLGSRSRALSNSGMSVFVRSGRPGHAFAIGSNPVVIRTF